MSLRALLAAIAAFALVACSAPADVATSGAQATSPSGRLTQPDAAVTYPRPFQAARLVEARVGTTGSEVLVVSGRLESPLFSSSPARDNPVRLRTTGESRVRLPLGEAVCPAPDGESSIVLTLDVDGRAVEETVRADDAVLREINADECAARAVLDVAAPSFGAVLDQDAERIETTVVLTRGSKDDAVALDSMTGNIVFTVALDEAAERTLAAGEPTLAVPAVVTVGRCDPHVFAESKKTWVFPVFLVLGDGEPQYVEFQPDATTRAALQQLFDDCGEAQRDG